MLTSLRLPGPFGAAVLACLIAVSDGARGQAFYAANGHYYEFVAASNITWQAAKTAAETRVYAGVHGHLVTIGSPAENAFVTSLATFGGFAGAWIGATSPPFFSGITWRWVVGPESGDAFAQLIPVTPPAIWSFGFCQWSQYEFVRFPGHAFLGVGGVGNGSWFADDDGVPDVGRPVLGYLVEYEVRPTTPTQYGDNFYQFVWRPHMTWQGAFNTASAMTFRGVPGHLVTLATPGENAFAAGVAANAGVDPTLVLGTWIAAQIDGGGTARWMAGPENGVAFSNGQTPIGNAYVNWGGVEPNSLNGFGWMSIAGSTGYAGFEFGRWLDDDNGEPNPSDPVVGFIVEYEQVPCRWQSQALPAAAVPSQIVTLPTGDIVSVGGTNVQVWNGLAWTVIGTASGPVTAVVGLSDGNVVIAGDFAFVNGTPASGVARWNGATWSPVGALPSHPSCLLVLPNDELAAGVPDAAAGASVVRWANGVWTPLGAMTHPVLQLARAVDGAILAVADVTSTPFQASSQVWAWNGQSWTAWGTTWGPATQPVAAAVPVLVGEPLQRPVLGFLDTLYEWQQGSWVAFKGGLSPNGVAGSCRAMIALNDGSLVVAGSFASAGALPAANIVRLTRVMSGNPALGGLDMPVTRWAEWSSVGAGTDNVSTCLARGRNGDVLVLGGEFTAIGGQPSPFMARITTFCPAAATTFAPGCPSSGGNNLLTADLPWVDGTLRAKATGLPTSAIVLRVTGLSHFVPGAPLAAAFAEAPIGCNLAVSTDILSSVVTTDGTAELSLPLPNSPPLVGVTFYHQMVPFELGPAGEIVSVTATNAVQLTAGMF